MDRERESERNIIDHRRGRKIDEKRERETERRRM